MFKHNGFIVIGGVILLVLGLIFIVIHDTKKWNQFKSENNCKVVGKMSGDVSNGVGISSSGSLVVTTNSTSSKTGWLCDDGITYWR